MNKQRRGQIDRIIEALTALLPDLEEISEAEADVFEAMPEGLQASERGQIAEAAAENLAEAVDGLQDIIELLEEAKGE